MDHTYHLSLFFSLAAIPVRSSAVFAPTAAGGLVVGPGGDTDGKRRHEGREAIGERRLVGLGVDREPGSLPTSS